MKSHSDDFDVNIQRGLEKESKLTSLQIPEILLPLHQNIHLISAYSFALIVLGFVLIKALYQLSKLNEQKKTN